MARGIYKVDMVGVHTAHKMHSLWLLLVALLSIQCARVAGLGCVDEQGQQVDWFIVYKFPYAKGKNNAIFSGYNYAYQVPDKTGWQLSAKQITDPKESILARTLNPVLGTQQKAYNTLFYSDQPPVSNVPGSESTGSSSSSMAHAKGVVATDAIKGFWLIHSVPSFVQVDKTVSCAKFSSLASNFASPVHLPLVRIPKRPNWIVHLVVGRRDCQSAGPVVGGTCGTILFQYHRKCSGQHQDVAHQDHQARVEDTGKWQELRRPEHQSTFRCHHLSVVLQVTQGRT